MTKAQRLARQVGPMQYVGIGYMQVTTTSYEWFKWN